MVGRLQSSLIFSSEARPYKLCETRQVTQPLWVAKCSAVNEDCGNIDTVMRIMKYGLCKALTQECSDNAIFQIGRSVKSIFNLQYGKNLRCSVELEDMGWLTERRYRQGHPSWNTSTLLMLGFSGRLAGNILPRPLIPKHFHYLLQGMLFCLFSNFDSQEHSAFSEFYFSVIVFLVEFPR